MLIDLKVKTLDARTHDFSIDNEITIRQFKDQIAEKTNISADNQRLIYQGRVLADEKQVKEYDVIGKVLHVAERPPFSQRGANARNNDEPRPTRNARAPGNMRNSPLFRAIDGMLLGTMTIPVSASGVPNPNNIQSTFSTSSSFCMNRITVARHMINCANNIAIYLENPERGLNNPSLDILERGRWTMESTVVEVGVSADVPRNNQNLIDMVQGAVSAALSRNNRNRNYTVLQLPSVFTSNEEEPSAVFPSLRPRVAPDAVPLGDNIFTAEIPNENGAPGGAAAGGGVAAGGSGVAAGGGGAAAGSGGSGVGIRNATAVIIEDDLESPEGGIPEGTGFSGFRNTDTEASGTRNTGNAFGGNSNTGNGTSGNRSAANDFDGLPPTTVNVSDISIDAATNEGSQNGGTLGPLTRRRTGTSVLSGVIEQYRRVQTRLNPFIEQYYELLRNEPTFAENDTTGRENAQRIFDRVSEAFHYISHAMHAISDLMLDLSNPAPRYLTCRPILVEQSGYIRSNNAPPLSEIITQSRAARSASAGASVGASNPSAGGAAAASSTPPASATINSSSSSNAAAAAADENDFPLNEIMEAFENDAIQAAAASDRSSSLAAETAIIGAANSITEMAVGAAIRAANNAAQTAVEAAAQASAQATQASAQASQASAQAAQASAQAALASAQAARVSVQASQSVEDPVDEPIVTPETPRAANAGNRGRRSGAADTPEIRLSEPPRFRLYVPYNPQAQMARFLQAVVNSATHGATEVQVQVAPPNVISINVPTISARAVPLSSLLTSAATGGETGNASNSSPSTPPNTIPVSMVSGGSSSSGNDTPVNANTITLPTTSTQTRSTSRPQLQIGGGNHWGSGRFTANTAFDRFLPCNSHHIRESEANTSRSSGQSAATSQDSSSSDMESDSPTLHIPFPLFSQGRQARQRQGEGVVRTSVANSNDGNIFITPNSSGSGAGVGSNGARMYDESSISNLSGIYSWRNSTNRGAAAGGDSSEATGTISARGGRNRTLSFLNMMLSMTGINRRFSGLSSGSSSSSSSSNTSHTQGGRFLIDDMLRFQLRHQHQRSNFLINILNNHTNQAGRSPRSNLRVNRSTQSMGGRVNATTMTQQRETQSRNRNTSQPRGTSSTRAPTTTVLNSSLLMNTENLRSQLRTFLNQIVFEGGPINEHTTPGAINRALSWFGETLHYLPQYERPEYNSRDSVCNILRLTLDVFIKLCNEDNEHVQFEQRLKQICEQFRTRLYSVLFVCVGSDNAELYWGQLMRLLLVPLELNFRNEALQFLCIYLNPTIPASTDTDDVKQFLVLRSVGGTTSVTMSNNEGNGIDGDIEMADVASTSDSRTSSVDSRGSSSSSSIAEPLAASGQPSAGAATAPEPTLPHVRLGSETWHSSFPTDWLPTITRDIQAQNEDPPTQPPYSDAYISGMSAKRRKIIQTNKPSSSVGSLIADSVRIALIANNLGPSTASSQTLTADAVANAISQDSTVQSSYTETVRTSMRERLKSDPDYKKDKYPQASKFVNDK